MSSSTLTRKGYEKLAKELDHLVTIKRPQVAALLQEALEGDDAQEDIDASLEWARQEQSFVEGRIMVLERLLSNPKIVDGCNHSDKVEFGATVTLRGDDGEVEMYTIVGPEEASPQEGRISQASPLGSALIGRCPGEVVTVKAPAGNFNVVILSIE